jgi:hypothetical protein
VSDASSRRSCSTDLGSAGDCCACRRVVIIRSNSALPTFGLGRSGRAAGGRICVRTRAAGSGRCFQFADASFQLFDFRGLLLVAFDEGEIFDRSRIGRLLNELQDSLEQFLSAEWLLQRGDLPATREKLHRA